MGEPFEACREVCDGILHRQTLDLPQRGKEAEDAEFLNSLPSLLLCSSAAKANVLPSFSRHLPLGGMPCEGLLSPLERLINIRLRVGEADEP